MYQEKPNIQVDKSYYFKKYDHLNRFASYYYQIKSIIEKKPESIFEIGIGNKTVSNYLKQAGYNVTTCDFDKDLEPDIVCDVRKIPIQDDSFDMVVACEVLEHLPFSDFEKALEEIKRVSKKNVILSFPYACIFWENIITISIPFLRKQFHFSLKVPYFFSKVKLSNKNKEHYWEIGTKGYSKKTVRNILRKHFLVLDEFHPPLNTNHYFFILKK